MSVLGTFRMRMPDVNRSSLRFSDEKGGNFLYFFSEDLFLQRRKMNFTEASKSIFYFITSQTNKIYRDYDEQHAVKPFH